MPMSTPDEMSAWESVALPNRTASCRRIEENILEWDLIDSEKQAGYTRIYSNASGQRWGIRNKRWVIIETPISTPSTVTAYET